MEEQMSYVVAVGQKGQLGEDWKKWRMEDSEMEVWRMRDS